MTDLTQQLKDAAARHVNMAAYTERDGGPWYCIAGVRDSYHGAERVADDFDSRDDARRFLIFLLGGEAPAGKIEGDGIFVRLHTPTGNVATVWTRECERVAPGRLADLPRA